MRFEWRRVFTNFFLLPGIVASVDVEEGLKDVDVAVLVGAFPRREGMERKDLLEKNCAIFKQQGAALAKVANKNVKVCMNLQIISYPILLFHAYPNLNNHFFRYWLLETQLIQTPSLQ